MATQASTAELVAALYQIDGKAEIVGGEIVLMSPTGGIPSRAAQGAPIFAAEVRSEDDYGPAAERAMAAKRADYFAAGTQVVWDVDVLRERLIRAYRATAPDAPAVYRRGERADAEPALPGWTFPVDEVFE